MHGAGLAWQRCGPQGCTSAASAAGPALPTQMGNQLCDARARLHAGITQVMLVYLTIVTPMLLVSEVVKLYIRLCPACQSMINKANVLLGILGADGPCTMYGSLDAIESFSCNILAACSRVSVAL